MLAIPAASLALVGAHAGVYPITSAEAVAALTAQLHRQDAARLHGSFRGNSACTGQSASQQVFNSTTRLRRWRCTIELSGAHFPTPCKAEAYVLATDQAHHVRIDWVAMSQTCHATAG